MMIKKSNTLKLLGITFLLMFIPLLANWFSKEFHWKPDDFILMGTMIFVTGLINMKVMGLVKNKKIRWIIISLIILLFILAWAELAIVVFDTPFAGS